MAVWNLLSKRRQSKKGRKKKEKKKERERKKENFAKDYCYWHSYTQSLNKNNTMIKRCVYCHYFDWTERTIGRKDMTVWNLFSKGILPLDPPPWPVTQ